MAKDFVQTYDFLKTLYADVMSMLSKLCVKRYDMARGCETIETARAWELYYACLRGDRYFYNFKYFDLDILQKFLDPATASLCRKDANQIPDEYRAEIVEMQAQRVLETYEEKNEYYRMLMGKLPNDATRKDYIYVTDVEGIDPNTPVHELGFEEIALLETNGRLAQLKEMYPNAGYLDFLGGNAIDLVEARTAKPYEILRLGPPSSNRTREMLENEYHMARRYVMSVINNEAMFQYRELYYPYIGIIILSIAVRNTLVPNEADYYNFEEILDAILQSYGLLKYFKKFPFTYKQRLVLALDKILMVKGTDGVLVDICKLFAFDNVVANRYYLMKTHMKDADGNIIFTGDPNQDFDLNFVKADIEEHEIDFNQDDIVSYEEVTNSDYLWQLTPEELTSLKSEDFNLMMSKYIDVEAAFDVTALTFEICCFNNLVLYARNNLQDIRVTNMYATTGYVTVWGMLVFLLAALAQKSNFDGNIVYEPPEIAEIMRFNYGEISEELQAIINKYELAIDVDNTLLDDYDTIELAKPAGNNDAFDIIKIYVDNRDLYNAILDEMAITDDIRRYQALSEAKDLLFCSAMEKKSFRMTSGEVASTYREMLDNIDPRMGTYLDNVEDEHELNDIILYILEKLEDTFSSPELKYLYMNTANLYNSLISQYLRIAINVFKASSVQLDSINIFLYVGDHEPIRVIDDAELHRNLVLDDTIHIWDEIATHKTIYMEDYIMMMDKGYTNIKGGL